MRFATAAAASALATGAVASVIAEPEPEYYTTTSAYEPEYTPYEPEYESSSVYEPEYPSETYDEYYPSETYEPEYPSETYSDYYPETTTYDDYEYQYTTEVVEHYETYCPEPTHITYNDKTYTVTEATTLTIEDCPCTVTYPVTTYAPTTESKYVPPPVSTYSNNATVPTTYYTPAPSATKTAEPTLLGAANRAAVGSGAGLAALFGFVAYVL